MAKDTQAAAVAAEPESAPEPEPAPAEEPAAELADPTHELNPDVYRVPGAQIEEPASGSE